MPNELLSRGLDGDISTVHERFATAMERRLPKMPLETKERYFAVLSSLVTKLETPEKNLRDILQEIMAEAAGYILQEMGAAR
ncbi:MAG: hypothetical protein ACE5I7_12590 [Candidatus Binatia bacterium]